MSAAEMVAKPKYTKEQEDRVMEWAKRTILKDAQELNDKRCLSLGITLGIRQTHPLPEPFETIRAIWNVFFPRRKR